MTILPLMPADQVLDLSLHHVGIAVEDIRSSGDIYVRRYGYSPRTQIIHDPTQTAYIQFFQLSNDPCYLELVAPDGQKSKLHGYVRRGGGPHHLCYAVGDIANVCNHLWSSGMALIASPAPAIAFHPRRIAWLTGQDGVLIELVERGSPGEL